MGGWAQNALRAVPAGSTIPARVILGMEDRVKREKPTSQWVRRGFFAAFCALTFFLWCPLGYGRYGEVGRVFGVPSWAAIAVALAAALFVLEWIYLFHTGLAVTDDGLADVVSELTKVDLDGPAPKGEDE